MPAYLGEEHVHRKMIARERKVIQLSLRHSAQPHTRLVDLCNERGTGSALYHPHTMLALLAQDLFIESG
ncbi:protein of unknown function [uncultured Woeseiaceae bacterium]|uniref:Uncharacterized protein n=1 Tax=uncultured Woeseiaceae bacterium TaxID=1983305 RepID=A0A7D9H6U7_9GAMM|nr:protein of unknown function [uncultured Woeseiaceae bacterium]